MMTTNIGRAIKPSVQPSTLEIPTNMAKTAGSLENLGVDYVIVFNLAEIGKPVLNPNPVIRNIPSNTFAQRKPKQQTSSAT